MVPVLQAPFQKTEEERERQLVGKRGADTKRKKSLYSVTRGYGGGGGDLVLLAITSLFRYEIQLAFRMLKKQTC